MADVGGCIDGAINWLVQMVDQLGVVGIFVMTFLESTFAPIPSEITMIPAGYLVQQEKMGLIPVLIASITGTIGGACFNYWLAKTFGRTLFLRYGKYFMMTPEKLEKLETFFKHHGAISMFTGRLVPGLRHYISFPAGLARMPFKPFLIYTALGGALWMIVLITLGYHIGKNQELVMAYMPKLKLGVVVFVLALVAVYVIRHRIKKKAAA